MRQRVRRWHRIVDAVETREDVLVVSKQRLQINTIKTESMHIQFNTLFQTQLRSIAHFMSQN